VLIAPRQVLALSPREIECRPTYSMARAGGKLQIWPRFGIEKVRPILDRRWICRGLRVFQARFSDWIQATAIQDKSHSCLCRSEDAHCAKRRCFTRRHGRAIQS